MIQQILLASGDDPYYSGRGVRVRMLKPAEKDKASERAAFDVGPEGSVIAYRNRELREGAKLFIVQVTKKSGFKSQDELNALKDTDWVKPTLADLTDEGPLQYDHDPETGKGLFTPKDDAILCNRYRAMHEVSAKEVEAIAGKALPVSSG